MSAERYDRSSDEIRRDIDHTRSEIDRTLDALADRFTPGQLVDQLWRSLRGPGGNIAESLGDHAVPLALMGLGVAWLAVEKATGSSTTRRADDHEPWSQDVEGEGLSAGEKVGEWAREAKDRTGKWAEQAKGRVEEGLGHARERVESAGGHNGGGQHLSERARSLSGEGADRARDLADRGREQSRQLAGRARRGFTSLMDESPLAVGAVFLGLGLAFGLAARSTRFEDELVGDTSEALKQQATGVARDVAESAREVGRDVVETVREEAGSQDPLGQAVSSAERIAGSAADTARRRAQEEGLDREGLEKRAKEEAERAKENVERGEHR